MSIAGPNEREQWLEKVALTGYMHQHVNGFEGPHTLSQFAGGQSNPTYKLETPKAAYVLRRKPPGISVKSAHAVDREYRVIEALEHTSFPVPNASDPTANANRLTQNLNDLAGAAYDHASDAGAL